MKYVIVGDLHVTPGNLEDTGKIFDLIADVKIENNIAAVIFTGDIFHTHSIVRQEVGHFLKHNMKKLRPGNVVIIAGNHDGMSPHSVEKNALRMVLEGEDLDHIFIADSPVGFEIAGDSFALVPFMSDNEKFVDACKSMNDSGVLICHQTVSGAHYENKHLAIGGVDQNRIPQEFVIAGHIHMEQKVGKVTYVGTPRALNASEYNENKGIFLFDYDSKELTKIPTGHLVKQFFKYEINESSDLSLEEQLNRIKTIHDEQWKERDDVRIQISGSEEFYKSVISRLNWLSGHVRFIPNIKKNLAKAIDSDSVNFTVDSAFRKYVFEIYSASENTKDEIWKKLTSLHPQLGSKSYS